MGSLARCLVALLTLALAGVAAASPGEDDLESRPDPEGTPTPVQVGIFLVDLYAIDDVAQSFEVDFFVSVRWSDPRLAAEPGGVATYDPDEIWTPEPGLLNARSVTTTANEVTVDADGLCRYAARHQGKLSFRSDLHDFPLDRQALAIKIYIPQRVGSVILENDPEVSAILDEVSVPNWRLLGTEWGPSFQYLPQLRQDVSLFSMSMLLERYRSYYVWKLIVPLLIVVLMSWSVFWISPKAVIQLGLGATSVLTLIAYRFATATLLPPVGYLSRLDLFLTGSSVLVFGALIEAIVTVRLGDRDRMEAAERVDRLARITFPIAYVLVLVWAFVV